MRANSVLSPKTQYNLKNAKEYFEEHLCVGDYYSEDERIAGQWIGNGAALLGLGERVRRDEFLRLCENLHPQTGELQTQRRKTIRRELDEDGDERETANRRVFYDFTFSPPKDVSILALVGADQRITAAHDRAVKCAVAELEQFAATRIRSAGASADRCTANVVGAIFRHETSRALDPHLHSHCILFNATHDATEDRWKALQNYEMLRAQKYVENVYYHELARELGRLGYEVENQARGDLLSAEFRRNSERDFPNGIWKSTRRRTPCLRENRTNPPATSQKFASTSRTMNARGKSGTSAQRY